jgi:N-acetylglucosamine kinase-like BadF-type ATPase
VEVSDYFLGVDGGQSSTTALIGDSTGRVIGFGRGGPCNHVGEAEGRDKFLNAVGGCVREACAQAGIKAVFEAACLGFSGGPADKESLIHEFLTASKLFVTHDALIALAGACGGEPGIITIAGTGSIAFARAADGRVARAGGWGHIFGDEGSGFDIARQALRAALRYEEGWGPSTALYEKLLEVTGARNANELMHWFYTTDYPRSRVALFAQLVDLVAQAGDREARRILADAGRELFELGMRLHEQLFTNGEAARVSYIGGVFRSELVRETFSGLWKARIESAQVGPPDYGPAAGALIEAYRLRGIHPKLSNLPESEK